MFLFIELVLNFIVQVIFVLQNANHVLLLVPLNLMGQLLSFSFHIPFFIFSNYSNSF